MFPFSSFSAAAVEFMIARRKLKFFYFETLMFSMMAIFPWKKKKVSVPDKSEMTLVSETC